MRKTILQLQEEMEQAIGQIWGRKSGDLCQAGTEMTEQCYQVAARYWERVRHLVRQSGFPDDSREIEFFKNIKPGFTSLLEYYLLLYRFQVHADADSATQEQFRQDELDRIRKFRETHASFIIYYEQGRTEWDDLYFLRRKFNKVQRPPSQIYDRVTDFWTNGDWIVTLLNANRRFELFLNKDVKDIEGCEG
jgi:hypothetical protein